MTPAWFLDTNVLRYALSREEAEREKRAAARWCLQRTDRGLSAQVLIEPA